MTEPNVAALKEARKGSTSTLPSRKACPRALDVYWGDTGLTCDTPHGAPHVLETILREIDFSPVTNLRVLLRDHGIAESHAQVIRLVMASAPSLHEVVFSGGVPASNDFTRVTDLCRNCTDRGMECSMEFRFQSNIEIAGLHDEHSALGQILIASRSVTSKGVRVRWSIPITNKLVYRLESLFSLASDEHIDAVLDAPWTHSPVESASEFGLSADDALFLWDFITYRLLTEESQFTSSPGRLMFYRRLQKVLAGRPLDWRSEPVGMLVSKGESAISWSFTCSPRFDRQPAAGSASASAFASSRRVRQALNQASDLGEVALEGGRAFLQWLRFQTLSRSRSKTLETNRRLPTVLLIGAYGGEHIGDSAILGGVLFRMHRRHGTEKAILVSQRARHTRHLIPMLDTPVEIQVEEYEQSKMRRLLELVDAVVFAGGPLMDLPKQLVKHLYTVSLAKRIGKPFLIEGIGAGPFRRWPSFWTGRRLALMADRIAVRTRTDREAPLVRDLDAEIGRDPAFDYLETRSEILTKIPKVDHEWINKLLENTEDCVTVGLNIRPIPHEYTEGASKNNRLDYSRMVESRFEERLAQAFKRFSGALAMRPCFIFFPMNAIQFGRSDLVSAYRIKRLLPANIDFRIWEADASIDGVVALLRRLDIVITMRFHATIYALSQQKRVIGIDYRVGKDDKVAALLSDFGQSENCSRVDLMTAEWLFNRLSLLSPGIKISNNA